VGVFGEALEPETELACSSVRSPRFGVGGAGDLQGFDYERHVVRDAKRGAEAGRGEAKADFLPSSRRTGWHAEVCLPTAGRVRLLHPHGGRAELADLETQVVARETFGRCGEPAGEVLVADGCEVYAKGRWVDSGEERGRRHRRRVWLGWPFPPAGDGDVGRVQADPLHARESCGPAHGEHAVRRRSRPVVHLAIEL